jgi:hypothetical protein
VNKLPGAERFAALIDMIAEHGDDPASIPVAIETDISHIFVDLDDEVGAFRDRSLAGQTFLYVFVDATYCKARVDRRVVSQAIVVATGVAGDGGHRSCWASPLGTPRTARFGLCSCAH